MVEVLRTLDERIDPAHTAIVVVDMQNDFCAEGGYVHKTKGGDMSGNGPLATRDLTGQDLCPVLSGDEVSGVVGVPIGLVESNPSYRDPNCVKLVRDGRGRALYFSRSPIPFVRDGRPDFAARPVKFLQHLGLYAYRREFLLELAAQPPAQLELTEKLEQLRVLALGRPIQVGVVSHAGRGVDTLDDYQRFVAAHLARPAEPARAA